MQQWAGPAAAAAAVPRRCWQAPPRQEPSACSSSSSSSSSSSNRGGTLRAIPLGLLANADVLYEPTGVPLVDELMKLPSVDAAAAHSLHLLAFLAATAAIGTLLLRLLDSAAGRRISAYGRRLNVGAALLSSALRPCKVMLPIYCASRAATVALALAQVAVTRLNGQVASLLSRGAFGRWLATLSWLALAAGGRGGGSQAPQLLVFLEWLTQLVQDCSELVAIVTVAWAAMEFKTRLIRRQVAHIQTDADPHNDGAVPLLGLLGAGLSILIVSAAIAVALVGFGFHIGPLMASVGGLGVVAGLATQGLLSNIAAAVSLYVTRPFVSGDHVLLVNPEGVEVEGTVLNIEPTRTILQDAASGCIVHISNAEVAEFIIKNYTQCRTLSRLQELQAGAGWRGGAGYI